MKKYLSIILGKLIILIEKLFKKNASVFPGTIALSLDNNILGKFTLPPLIIAVTGSSGKGSITKLVTKALKENGYSVIYNDNSNLKRAITTLLIKNCDIKGVIKKDALVMEIDERYTKLVFPYIKPNYVVITNITRDQPPRQGHFDVVFNEIKSALTKDMKLILNADDPYIAQLNLDNNFNATYYTLDETKYDSQTSLFSNLNIMYCPKCHKKLIYDFYHFESLGSYYCQDCNFKNPIAKYHINNVDYKNNSICINDTKIKLNSSILYSIYNTSAAYTLCSELKLKNISKIINSEPGFSNKIITLNNKNENSSTFNQSLFYIKRFKNKKVLVIGWKEISRRYEHFDISWLYDIDFEILKNSNIEKIVCVGINRYDIALRIKYAGFNEKNILTYDSLEAASNYLKKSKYDIYAILNFDYVNKFNELMKEGK